MKKLLYGLTIVVFVLHGCANAKQIELRYDKLTLELGDEISYSVQDYVFLKKNEMISDYRIDLEQVEKDEAGTYQIVISKGKERASVELTLIDTTAPQYQGALSNDFLIAGGESIDLEKILQPERHIQDFSEVRCFFGEVKKISDDISIKDYEAENLKYFSTFVERKESLPEKEIGIWTFDEGGLYEIEIIIADSQNNAITGISKVYVDDEPPVIETQDYTINWYYDANANYTYELLGDPEIIDTEGNVFTVPQKEAKERFLLLNVEDNFLGETKVGSSNLYFEDRVLEEVLLELSEIESNQPEDHLQKKQNYYMKFEQTITATDLVQNTNSVKRTILINHIYK